MLKNIKEHIQYHIFDSLKAENKESFSYDSLFLYFNSSLLSLNIMLQDDYTTIGNNR